MDKKLKKQLRKESEMSRMISKEDWEESMLENNSYYDIDILNEYNNPIQKKIKYWEKEFKPVSFIGKWWAKMQIKRLKKKLHSYGK
jgi:hypothetical protein